MTPKLPRHLHGGDVGSDVEGVNRALVRGGFLLSSLPGEETPIRVFAALPAAARRRFNRSSVSATKRLQKAGRYKVTGVFGPAEFRALRDRGAVDAYTDELVSRWKPPVKSWEELAIERLLVSMREMSDLTPGYRLGGGHGIPLKDVSPRQRLDCSSSTSKALFDAGLFNYSVAWVSGQLMQWGDPGPGRLFTVYANPEHVWIRLYTSRWWRFDTSPHGDRAGSGPRLRYLPRFATGFVARHYPGL